VTTYGVARWLIWLITRTLWRVKAYGQENVPLTGPLLIAANHRSNLDPPILGAYCPRRISYMAKVELFRIPLLGLAIRSFGAYPVDRHGSATAAIKQSVAVLRAGGCCGIFPEGGRNLDGAREAHEGVALLASLAKCPVVPAALIGTDRSRQFAAMKVVYGKPMSLPLDRKATREDLAKFTDEIMSAIAALSENIGGNS
jgi:1-acyl-sn-glycerol-3-phosphate acyltransferase